MTLKPALTAEEWKMELFKTISGHEVFLDHEGDVGFIHRNNPHEGVGLIDCEDRHSLAALCLHEQPFGFTRADVRGLRYREQQAPAFWDDLIARIEAFLPPEDVA